MSGPGGPASLRTTMTPPGAVGNARAMGQIKANISAMIDKGATEDEVNAYIANEGVTVEQLQNSPAAAPFQKDPTEAKAYNPTLTQRVANLVKARQAGVRPPLLPSNASPFMRAVDFINGLGGASDAAARGFTGGLYDEAAGLGQGVGAALTGKPFMPAFKEGMDATNANIANFKEDNPVTGYGFEGLGMVASPLMRVGASAQAAAPTMVGRAVRAAGVGAGEGALTGAAYSEGDLNDRLLGAGLGAAGGALIGGIAAPTLETATRGVQTFMDTLNARRAAAADPAERARQMLASAIARDNFTPVPQQGEALASAGGPNVQALARQSTVAPGNARAAARDYFEGAAADRPDVIGQSVQRNISGNRLLPTLEALDRQQRATSGPAYDAFYALSPDAFDTPYFRNLMGGSIGQRLIRGAYNLGEIDRAAGLAPDNPMQYLLDAEGNVTLNQAPSARAVDLMKRAIDQEVANNTDAFGRIRGAEGNSWERLRRSFVANADRASTVDGVSLFGQARAAYAGPQALKDAANLGSQAFKGGQLTSQKAQAFNDLSPSEQQAFRIGLAEAVIEKAGNMGPATDPVQLFLKGRNANQLMRLYLGDQTAFDDFVRTLQQESRVVKAGNAVMGGSPTASRLAENADAAAHEQALTDQIGMAHDAWNLATGRGGGRVSAAINIFNRGKNATSGVSEPVADELGRMLFNPSAPANLSAVRALGPRVPQIAANQAAQDWLRRNIATYGALPASPVGAFIGSH